MLHLFYIGKEVEVFRAVGAVEIEMVYVPFGICVSISVFTVALHIDFPLDIAATGRWYKEKMPLDMNRRGRSIFDRGAIHG